MDSFQLFKSIKITRGFTRSILHDLQRERIEFIPNLLAEILKESILNKPDILRIYGEDEIVKRNIEKYFEYLIEGEYVFKLPKKFENNFIEN